MPNWSPSSSASTRGHKTEIDNVDIFPYATNEHEVSAQDTSYSAERNISPSEAKLRQVLDVLTLHSQPTPPGIPIDVMDSQPLSSEHEPQIVT